MKLDGETVIVLFVLTIATFAGFFIGQEHGKKNARGDFEKTVIERGFGEYREGEFAWKEGDQ